VSAEVTKLIHHAQLRAQENACQEILIFHKQFYFVTCGLKIIGHGNPDNNLESLCIYLVSFNVKEI
jgi:hypothetical protein